jgi:hypothetical protein
MFIKNDGSLWAMGLNYEGDLGNGTSDGTVTNRPQKIISIPAQYNRIAIVVRNDGYFGLSFVGVAGSYYALDRSDTLVPPNWVSQATNYADSTGLVLFTVTPKQNTNNFWRTHAVPFPY